MIRLGVLVLATLAGLFVILTLWGDDDLRAARRAPADPRPAAATAGAGPMEVTPEPPADLAPTLVAAQSQTPERVQRFPGPALRPSPEFTAETPAAPATAAGPVLFVTGDRVNMRAGPSTSDRVMASLGRGSAVTALGSADGDWTNIRDADGRVGYVASRFLAAEAP